MADYFLDDAANGTNSGASWETCFNTWEQVDTAGILTSGNRLIVGADANITDPGASLTIIGPTSGPPTTVISSDVGTGVAISYSAGTGNQIDTSSGTSYDITIDGSFVLYGLRLVTGRHFVLNNDADEVCYYEDTTFVMSDNGRFSNIGTATPAARTRFIDCTITLAADTTARSTSVIESAIGNIEFVGPTFVSGGNRTGRLIEQSLSGGVYLFTGVDFSSFDNGTTCELFRYWSNGAATLFNCKFASSYTLTEAVGTGAGSTGSITAINCSATDAPEALHYEDALGTIKSAVPVRTGGATVETIATSWIVSTRASVASEMFPFYTPWIYGLVSSTGSKTFTLAIANDTESFDDSEVWLEVDFLSTLDNPLATRSGGRSAAARTAGTTNGGWATDTPGSWAGVGAPSTYEQLLTVTETVGETGLYRARVCIGKSSATLYVDPKVVLG